MRTAFGLTAAQLAGMAGDGTVTRDEADRALAGDGGDPCPDPGPCVNGPAPHQWRASCQQDRS